MLIFSIRTVIKIENSIYLDWAYLNKEKRIWNQSNHHQASRGAKSRSNLPYFHPASSLEWANPYYRSFYSTYRLYEARAAGASCSFDSLDSDFQPNFDSSSALAMSSRGQKLSK